MDLINNTTDRPKAEKNKFVGNFILVLISVVVALVVVEIGLRLVAPVEIETTIPDQVLGHKFNPKVERYDDNGFHNEVVLDKADIVAIGDSQTEGNNTSVPSEAWPQVLGSLLDKQVYQMAVGGYGPLHYLYLVDEAIKLEPEMVIMGFYTGNDTIETYLLAYGNDYWEDFRDANFSLGEELSKVDPNIRTILQYGHTPDSWQYKIFKIRQWFRSKSYTYTLLGKATRNLRERLNLAEKKNERNERIATQLKELPELAFVYEKEPISAVLSPSYRLDSVDLSSNIAREGFKISKEAFIKSADKLKEKNINFAIVMIPTKEMVYGVYMKQSGEVLNEFMVNFIKKEEELRDEFFNFCADKEIICIDVLSKLVDALVNDVTIYPSYVNGHPIPAGYKVIAESVYEFLLNKNI